jgi:hypothetical protein
MEHARRGTDADADADATTLLHAATETFEPGSGLQAVEGRYQL